MSCQWPSSTYEIRHPRVHLLCLYHLASTRENLTFIFNNYSFSGCSVTLSSQIMNQSTEKPAEIEQICRETLKDIYLADIFVDKKRFKNLFI